MQIQAALVERGTEALGHLLTVRVGGAYLVGGHTNHSVRTRQRPPPRRRVEFPMMPKIKGMSIQTGQK
ncbi:hypothetical protein Acsp02_35750 [Actinoplanes sp. NBRC 103695]|nr:hypothetical protein Acsp02_35750 [Actinoplanes sp. NBRC 103695]